MQEQFMNLEGLNSIWVGDKDNLINRVEKSLLDYFKFQKLSSGDQLPSQSVLAKTLGISSSTLRETLSRLEAKGVVRSEHGKGTFIDQDPNLHLNQIDLNLSTTQMILEQGMVPGTEDIITAMEPLPKVFHDCFGSEEAQKEFFCIRRVRTANGEPFAYNVSYLSEVFHKYSEALSNIKTSVYEFIQTKTEECISETEAVIYAGFADKLITSKLEIPLGSPVLIMRQVHFNSEGKPLIASREYFPHSFLKLKVKIRQL